MYLPRKYKSLFLITSALVLATLFAGCAASPFKLEGVDRIIQPQDTLKDRSNLNKRVLWGGLIVATRNFKDHSQIEILSYPLHSNGEPRRTAEAQGRFILKISGFTEPAQYAAGRWISAIGKVRPAVQGKIGNAEYTYPVLQAEEKHLWPGEESESDIKTRFHFGIGISL